MYSKYIKKGIILVVIGLFLLLSLGVYEIIKNRSKYFENPVVIAKVSVLDYQDNIVHISVKPNNRQMKCSIVHEKTEIDNLKFESLDDGNCTSTISIEDNYVYFKSYLGIVSEPILINNYVYENDLEDLYYLAIGSKIDFNNHIKTFGDSNFKVEYDGDFLEFKDNILTGIKDGNSILKIYYNDEIVKESKIYVTKGITQMPKEFDYKKKHLMCGAYSEEDNKLMDEILAYRINQAGYETRAGVVAAARFLTMEFPYRIAYFYENGRVHESSPHYCDGEGRYYHTGLYLNKYKFSDIEKSVAGPATWGCYLTNYEPDPPKYIPFTKVPNGLDCSGFVSWAILNGGFDVGDIGAGESAYKHQMTDQGEYTPLTKEIIESGTIKVGDLFNYSGHIAILIGQDEKNYYIAESLPTFNGLITKTYEKTKVNKVFTHVVLMDVFYKEDGNLTDLWY